MCSGSGTAEHEGLGSAGGSGFSSPRNSTDGGREKARTRDASKGNGAIFFFFASHKFFFFPGFMCNLYVLSVY